MGTGRFGEVHLGKVKSSGQLVAIKSVLKNKKELERKHQIDEVDSLTREIEIHSSLDHPKIVKMFRHFEDDNRIYLILVSVLINLIIYKYENSFGTKLWLSQNKTSLIIIFSCLLNIIHWIIFMKLCKFAKEMFVAINIFKFIS